jgi:putative DNA primase/helicase
MANAARLDHWLIQYCRREQTNIVPTKTVQQFGPSGLREKIAIDSAMRELQDLGRARLEEGKRHRSIMVNPALLVEGDQA